MSVRLRLEGMQTLFKNMEQFPRTIQRRIVRKAVSAGSTPVLQAIRANTPRDSGQLKRSIGRKIKTYRNSGVVIAILGPRSGYKIVVDGRPRNPLRYASLVEYGTSKTPANPFMRRSYATTKQVAQETIRQKLSEEIANEAAKLKKTGKK